PVSRRCASPAPRCASAARAAAGTTRGPSATRRGVGIDAGPAKSAGGMRNACLKRTSPATASRVAARARLAPPMQRTSAALARCPARHFSRPPSLPLPPSCDTKPQIQNKTVNYK
ncbi:hypothetical protein O3G_MSEX000916, partial [Manduca sexta]